ncbi:MAG: hypothetical protein A2Y33_00100 [Spirochaetes bacterium GWF1_51_8]|nr:MAG: hypothetical protein A2Y33_00100 [Spirochaetes bacterium GWF1_51_8]
MRFGEVMLKLGMINDHQLDIALKEQEYNLTSVGYSEPIGNILLRNGIINDDQHATALVEYFKELSHNESEPSYVRETAKVAYNAMASRSRENSISDETKIIILQKISEYEDKIGQFNKSIATLSKMELKKVITETIDKEKKEIDKLIGKIESLRKDLEQFA